MSFFPPKIGESLFGVADPVKFVDMDYAYDKIHSPSHIHKKTMKYTIVLVFISAIIFVTVISIYDIFRNIISGYFNEKYIQKSHNNIPQENIERTIIADKNAIISSIIFALFCIVFALIFVPILTTISE